MHKFIVVQIVNLAIKIYNSIVYNILNWFLPHSIKVHNFRFKILGGLIWLAILEVVLVTPWSNHISWIVVDWRLRRNTWRSNLFITNLLIISPYKFLLIYPSPSKNVGEGELGSKSWNAGRITTILIYDFIATLRPQEAPTFFY